MPRAPSPGMDTRFPILVAIDDTEYAEVVIEHAVDQAARHDRPDLHVLRVVEKGEGEPDNELRWLERAVADALENVDAGRRTEWRAIAHVRVGKPADEIVDLAGDLDARLLVVGRFGMHGRHSTADRVVERAPCPTLVINRLGRDAGSEVSCPACVTVRAESAGTRWFCTEHAAPDRMRLSLLVPPLMSTRGSLY